MGKNRWGSAGIWGGSVCLTGESSGPNYTLNHVYTVA